MSLEAEVQNAEKGTLSERKRLFGALATGIVLLSTLLQLGCLRGEVVLDDHLLLYDPGQRGCGTNPLDCFAHPVFYLYYRPVMTATFAAGIGLHGPHPILFHLENLLLHAVVVAQALWIFRRLLRQDTAALLAVLLFALHPLQVGVTSFLGGRTDTLSLFFLGWFVIGLCQRGAAWRTLSVLSFTAAVFTKEQCAPLFLLMPLFLATQRENRSELRSPSRLTTTLLPLGPNWFGRGGRGVRERERADGHGSTLETPDDPPHSRPRGRLAEGPRDGSFLGASLPPDKRGVWWLLYGLPIVVYAILARRIMPFQEIESTGWSAAQRIEMVGRTLWYYVKALLCPTLRALHTSSLGAWEPAQWDAALLGIGAGLLWLIVLRRVWNDRALRALALWTTLTLLPCLNLWPVPSQFASPYRAVLPLFGMAGLAGAALARALERAKEAEPMTGARRIWRGGRVEERTEAARRVWLGAALVGVAVAFIALTMADGWVWRDELRVVRMEEAADPDFLPGVLGLASVLQRRKRYAEALPVYDGLMAQVFPGAAGEAERIARRNDPRLRRRVRSLSGLSYAPPALVSRIARERGALQQALGRYEAAAADYRVALAYSPELDSVREGLATCYALSGHTAEAKALLRELNARAPRAPRLAMLGYLYTQDGEWEAARDALGRALALGPSPGLDRTAAQALYEEAQRRVGRGGNR